uniref:Uncharacterized protein n=1 Tax=viral metagenome TaxID=1070528 RepID=A0A6M3JDN0_9ZZZZ
MIIKCICRSDKHGNTKGVEYQEQKYGYGNRVFNKTKELKTYRCTICGFTKAK